MTVRVASYNIHKSVGPDRQRRPDRIFRVLAELDADIVALQEVDRRFGARATTFEAEQLEHETGYRLVRHAVSPLSSGWHGNALLVRGAVEAIDRRRITLPALEPRGALLADLETEQGRLRVVAAHLGLLGRYRRRQAETILEAIDSAESHLPTVVMGDLNEWSPHGSCLRVFRSRFDIAQPGPSFPARRPMFGLDRVITSDDIAVQSAWVHETPTAREASDHLPVVAELKVLAPGETAENAPLQTHAGVRG
ncbi:endonuclease/exonuclease/phosphatase family protein [Caenispirillum salinarum]|uniref:endonuclease/exonuclease/phosphatase family protein n=1 Tax=Caenispirillum salinarum TaxID=859058 RepID=UPI00384E7396